MIMNAYTRDDIHGPNRPESVSVETTRLSLNALRLSDLDDLMKVFSEKSTARMTHAVPHPLDRDAAEALLRGMMAEPYAYWAIRREDERLIGIISLTRSACGRAAGMHSFGPNLSVFIAPDHQNQGYAVEAIDGLLRWVKRRKLHKVIHAAHFADNEASAQVLVATDFLYTGRKTFETSLARTGEHLALHMIRIL
ncbi:MAG: GNAT family N-acetyltransferase [Asticcacaulis sp.]|nr:GNAT family N-acetyltransferase [Asticcacaulis sp.]